ncbi:hypothetical protein HDU89_004689 [Geranomyces variabilis]|nr:hypothetical protein HDU89_004689 [Geranomyces variabilis]
MTTLPNARSANRNSPSNKDIEDASTKPVTITPGVTLNTGVKHYVVLVVNRLYAFRLHWASLMRVPYFKALAHFRKEEAEVIEISLPNPDKANLLKLIAYIYSLTDDDETQAATVAPPDSPTTANLIYELASPTQLLPTLVNSSYLQLAPLVKRCHEAISAFTSLACIRTLPGLSFPELSAPHFSDILTVFMGWELAECVDWMEVWRCVLTWVGNSRGVHNNSETDDENDNEDDDGNAATTTNPAENLTSAIDTFAPFLTARFLTLENLCDLYSQQPAAATLFMHVLLAPRPDPELWRLAIDHVLPLPPLAVLHVEKEEGFVHLFPDARASQTVRFETSYTWYVACRGEETS